VLGPVLFLLVAQIRLTQNPPARQCNISGAADRLMKKAGLRATVTIGAEEAAKN
jgi:hypothetical protein